MSDFASLVMSLGVLLTCTVGPILYARHSIHTAGHGCEKCGKFRKLTRYPLLYDAALCDECLEACIIHNTDLLETECRHAR